MAWDWDLSYLYQSFDDPAFTADLARLPELKAAMEQAVHAELAPREKLEGLVEADDALSAVLDRLSSFCQLTMSVDATNETAAQYLDKILLAYNDFSLLESAFIRYVGALNGLDEIIASSAKLEEIAKPFHLRIEGPMDCDCDRETQMVALAGLTRELDERGINVELVADEWCNTLEDIKLFADNKAGHMVQIKTPDLGGINNTIEAVLYCKEKGIGAYQGGTCNETDRSAQVCVHCAMATQPDQILAKPGMGVDEGFMIVYNEMNRIIALRKAKNGRKN